MGRLILCEDGVDRQEREQEYENKLLTDAPSEVFQTFSLLPLFPWQPLQYQEDGDGSQEGGPP